MNKTKKMTTLETLQAKSNNAISLVRSTIDNLKATNEEIANEHNKNNEQISQLQNTNSALDGLKSDNEKIISNFEALLN